jgi:hypothetical protein
MKVFLSWSGERSHAVALVVYEWLMAVIQATRPWLSSEDIQRGAQWFGDTSTQLQESTVGIFCLTQKNKNAPWILFEAGAIAKGVHTNRICTLLIDLQSTDVLGPLSQFNHTLPNHVDMWKLAITINSALGDMRLTDSQLKKSFDAHWNAFEADFAAAVAENPEEGPPVAPPDSNEVLAEILASVRGLSSRIQHLESSAIIVEGKTEREIAAINYPKMSRFLAASLQKNIAAREADTHALIDRVMESIEKNTLKTRGSANDDGGRDAEPVA